MMPEPPSTPDMESYPVAAATSRLGPSLAVRVGWFSPSRCDGTWRTWIFDASREVCRVTATLTLSVTLLGFTAQLDAGWSTTLGEAHE
jgi:hypothetical protein